MNYNSIFNDKINCNTSEKVFDYLIDNLKDSILKWDYFVNWEKVNYNYRDIEISLNLLNYLIGKENIEQKAKRLFIEHPKLVNIVPALIIDYILNLNMVQAGILEALMLEKQK